MAEQTKPTVDVNANGHRPSTSTLTGTAQDRATAIVERCGGGREHAKGWTVRCPAHDDHTPSLHITAKEGMVLLHCWAGCTNDVILEVLSLTYQDLYEAQDWQRSSLSKPLHIAKRKPPPPGPVEPFALAWTVELVTEDVAMLTVDGCVAVLRQASTHPLQWLWVERTLAAAGMSPSVVWQVLYPQAECPYPPRREPTATTDVQITGRPLPSIRLGEFRHD